MKPFTARSAVLGAEHQLEQSRQESRERFAQVRSAVRARLARPSSLLVVTGLGMLFGVWFAHRYKARLAIAAAAPLANWVTTFLVRFGMRRLAGAWMRLRAPDPPQPVPKVRR